MSTRAGDSDARIYATILPGQSQLCYKVPDRRCISITAARDTTEETLMQKTTVATYSELAPLEPAYAIVAGVDLVVVRWEDEDQVSVLFGR